MTRSAFSPWSKFAGVVEEIEERGWGRPSAEALRAGLVGVVLYPGVIHELSAAETKACARDAAGLAGSGRP